MAVSKALVTVGKGGFEGSGLLNRDPRSVERKKPGQKKARKKFTWYVVYKCINKNSCSVVLL